MDKISKQALFEIFSAWNELFRSKITLVACGGTALTLQGIKWSTKNIDLILPIPGEYARLAKTLEEAGYQGSGNKWSGPGGFEFDFFIGKKVHTTELLEYPLDTELNICLRQWSHINLLALNDHDLIISKMFRGLPVDIDDCISLITTRGDQFNWDRLLRRYYETSSYDVNPERMRHNLSALFGRMSDRNMKAGKAQQQYERWFE